MVIKFNDLDMFNVIGLEMCIGFWDVFIYVEDLDNGVCCVVLIGEGCGFCLGVNF